MVSGYFMKKKNKEKNPTVIKLGGGGLNGPAIKKITFFGFPKENCKWKKSGTDKLT